MIDQTLEHDMIEWRRHLHRHPELGFDEHKTAAFVADRLEEVGITVTRGVGGTGVVGTLRSGSSSRRIGLRADMDALAIDENGNAEWQSQNPGKMHACDHDGHTSMLLGAATRHARASG
jgi:hippurate hydrolase